MVDVGQLEKAVNARLTVADQALAAQYPGPRAGRQPVHTCYVPADRFSAQTTLEWSEDAQRTLDQHADLLAELVAQSAATGAEDVIARVRAKLAREAVEDLRIDFEDGYGVRADDEEDAHVEAAAAALGETVAAGTAPAFVGMRMKSLEPPTRPRALRTLARAITAFAGSGTPFDRFVVTLPKVTSVDQVEAMAYVCAQLETDIGLPAGTLRFEIQVETPQSILGPDGTSLVARMIHAAASRCTALHFGTYDYTAFCGIAAEYQGMAHPAAEHAKLVMQAAAAGTGVRLSDGSTNILPVGEQTQVRLGWRTHLALVRRSLERGYYQGWDLHPAQLPSRYAATFAFYLESFDAAADRLRRYRSRDESGIADEPATARALADFLLRAVECGAVGADEVAARADIDAGALVALARPTRTG
jgi:citrate lyase beta subunit